MFKRWKLWIIVIAVCLVTCGTISTSLILSTRSDMVVGIADQVERVRNVVVHVHKLDWTIVKALVVLFRKMV